MGNKIDFSKLNYCDEPLSMEEALKDVIPLKLDDDVINGDKKIKVVSVTFGENGYAKIQIARDAV